MTFLSALADKGKRVEQHKPWPRVVVDEDLWRQAVLGLAAGEATLLGLWSDGAEVHLGMIQDAGEVLVVSLAAAQGRFPSVAYTHVPALRLERAIRDLYGLEPEGCPDQRRWLDHGRWGLRHPLGRAETADAGGDAYAFLTAEGPPLHQIPVGPVHAGIIEPGHFRFTANGETVVRLEERLGYVHKGIDQLMLGAPLAQAARVVARVSGDATVAYSFAFACAVEAAIEVEPPPRAQILRGIMAELERAANHFGDIGAICNDASFTLIHAYCGIFRERVLAAADRAFGHRLMMDRIVPGGVEDMSPGGARGILLMIEETEPQFAEVVRLYDDTPSLQDRTCTTGFVGKDLVTQWAAGGHVGRASGRDFDARRDLPYAPYTGGAFDVPVLTDGDVNARVWIRIREIEQSFRLLKMWCADLPTGPTRALLPPLKGVCEGVAVTEAFRGDTLVWVRLEQGRVARCHARDASWFQWPLLEAAVENNIVADFPLCNKSFNCSYSGHDL
jgi:Ni,Fe-hydrogenase III large subunit